MKSSDTAITKNVGKFIHKTECHAQNSRRKGMRHFAPLLLLKLRHVAYQTTNSMRSASASNLVSKSHVQALSAAVDKKARLGIKQYIRMQKSASC